jgi:hypothetical protein
MYGGLCPKRECRKMSEELTSGNLAFKVGDLVLAYQKGYFRVTRIEPRFVTGELATSHPKVYGLLAGTEMSPLVYYTPVANSKGEPRKGAEKSCDAYYVRLAFDYLGEAARELEATASRLRKLRNSGA